MGSATLELELNTTGFRLTDVSDVNTTLLPHHHHHLPFRAPSFFVLPFCFVGFYCCLLSLVAASLSQSPLSDWTPTECLVALFPPAILS